MGLNVVMWIRREIDMNGWSCRHCHSPESARMAFGRDEKVHTVGPYGVKRRGFVRSWGRCRIIVGRSEECMSL